MSDKAVISLDVEQQIATIEFYHPKGNSLPSDMLAELSETITDTGRREDVKVIILQSAGDGAFCAGASFDELIKIEDYNEGKQFFMGFARVINAMRKVPVFVLSRIHGKTVGGGVGLAAASDYALASDEAAVKLSELAIGIGPFVIEPAVQRKIGTSAFTQLAIKASDWFDADWAHRNGLFAEVYTDRDTLDQNTRALAEELAGYSSAAMQELKSVFWEGTEHWDQLLEQRAEISGRLVVSHYTRNFIKKFKER